MGRALAASIFVFCLCGAAFAADLDLAKKLTTKYKDQVLSMRHPLMSGHQEYGFDGAPVHPGKEGPWTLYGRVRIDDLAADNHQLQMKATRILCGLDKNGLNQTPDKERVTITVRLDHPLASEDEAVALVARVFALTPEDIVNSVPDYWREYLTKNMFGPPRLASPPGTSADAKEGDAKEKIFRLGDLNVTAPKPQYAPEPEYSETARTLHIQGMVGLNVIIDPAGAIQSPRIVSPLGFGLDESAIAGVRRWRFTPGTRNGENVSVALHIDVSYRQY